MAQQLKVPRSNLSAWERGRAPFPQARLEEYSRILKDAPQAMGSQIREAASRALSRPEEEDLPVVDSYCHQRMNGTRYVCTYPQDHGGSVHLDHKMRIYWPNKTPPSKREWKNKHADNS